MAVLEISQLKKIYNEDSDYPVRAVDNVDLTIEKGEFTAIVGPSGSGKTTLLSIMGGLDQPTSGKVVIDGQDIADLRDNQMIDFRLHHIGFVFQSYNLIPVLTAKENVSFVMVLQKRPKAEREARATSLLQEVGLGDRMDSRPSELSGGQQQRVAIARALASRPAFILADEPTANLDSKSASNLLDIMLKLNKEENITFVFSTHDSRVIERARRVVTLVDGKIVSDKKQNAE